MFLRQRSILDDHMVVVHHNKATVEAALPVVGEERARWTSQLSVNGKSPIFLPDPRQDVWIDLYRSILGSREKESSGNSCDVMSGFLAGFCWNDMTLFAIEGHAHVCVCAPFSRQDLMNSECQYSFDELKRRVVYLVASKSICSTVYIIFQLVSIHRQHHPLQLSS